VNVPTLWPSAGNATDKRPYWARRVLPWAVALAALAALMAADGWSMERIQRFCHPDGQELSYDEQAGPLRAFEFFGGGYCVIAGAVLIFVLDRRRQPRAFAFVFVVVLVSLKIAAGRARPEVMRREYERRAYARLRGPDKAVGFRLAHLPLAHPYETMFGGPRFGWRNGDFQSFPSGHAMCAAAQAVVLAAFYPWFAPAFYAVACVVGAERVYYEKHFISDVFAAFMLALWLGQLLLRNASFQRLCVRLAALPVFRRGSGEGA